MTIDQTPLREAVESLDAILSKRVEAPGDTRARRDLLSQIHHKIRDTLQAFEDRLVAIEAQLALHQERLEPAEGKSDTGE